jgi:hypothetical protein
LGVGIGTACRTIQGRSKNLRIREQTLDSTAPELAGFAVPKPGDFGRKWYTLKGYGWIQKWRFTWLRLQYPKGFWKTCDEGLMAFGMAALFIVGERLEITGEQIVQVIKRARNPANFWPEVNSPQKRMAAGAGPFRVLEVFS